MNFMFCLAATFWVLILMISTVQPLKHVHWCKFRGEYDCNKMPHSITTKLLIPQQACAIRDCSNCVVTELTRILDADFQLLIPNKFLLRTLNDPVLDNWHSTEYTCATKDGQRCDCEESQCNGHTHFCTFHNCTTRASCYCSLTNRQTELLHVADNAVLINPDLAIFKICLVPIPQNGHSHRRLLEKESATFQQNNLTLSFIDPILQLPDVGKVIIRTSDYEHIMDVPQDLMITLPFELLAFKNRIEIVYLHPKGLTVSGTIQVTGKSACQLRQCLLCKTVFQTIECWPTYFRYGFYILALIVLSIAILLLKLMLKTVWWFLRVFLLISASSLRLTKAIIRCALLLGAFIGTNIEQGLRSTHAFLENAGQRNLLPVTSTTILLFCFIFAPADASCSNTAIIQSEVKHCETLREGTQTCKISTTAEFTLPNIHAEQCIFFQDKKETHLFSIAVKLDAVNCRFNTKREYFTFPVTAKHLSQVSCFYNEYCGKGVHCQRSVNGKVGLHFEAESSESRNFPGTSSCTAGGLGVGCTILTRAACMFHRTWYEPDLLHSYEVSSVTGHTCDYQLSVTHTENNTVSRVSLTDSVYTTTGVRITLLGAFDQPQLHLTDSFVQRVGKPQEAYLVPTSKRNFPKAGEVGAIQANTSYTTDFIFDPKLTACDFFEDTLRCHTAEDAVKVITSSKEYALPMQKDLHLFKVDDTSSLQSSLLMSAAIRLQINFEDYKIVINSATVCPKLDDDFVETTGCYKCPILARIVIKAHSTCQAGVAFVNLQQITIHTKAIHLTSELSTFVIKFLAESRCYKEKLCLKAGYTMQCKMLQFCLDEPSVDLLHLNLNYTSIASVASTNNWFSWLHIPNFTSTFYLIKFIGASLVVLCMSITCFSTVITCCCRSR